MDTGRKGAVSCQWLWHHVKLKHTGAVDVRVLVSQLRPYFPPSDEHQAMIIEKRPSYSVAIARIDYAAYGSLAIVNRADPHALLRTPTPRVDAPR